MLLFSYVSLVLPATAKQSLELMQELLLTLIKLCHNLSEVFLGKSSSVNSIKYIFLLNTYNGKWAPSPNIVAKKRRLKMQFTNVLLDMLHN